MLSFFRVYFKQILSKILEYHNYSEFSSDVFLDILSQEPNRGTIYNSQDKQYYLFSGIFRTFLDHNVPLKI